MSTVERVLTFREILDQAISLLRTNLRSYLLPYALIFGVATAALTAVQLGWMGSLMFPGNVGATIDWQLFGGFGCVMALFWLFYFGLQTGLAIGAVSLVAGRSSKGSFAAAFKPKIYGTVFLSGIAIVISALFCFFPVLYVAPALAFIVPVMTEESRFGFEAFSGSHELARYNPRKNFLDTPMVRVLGLFLVTILVSWLLSMVIALPLMVLQQIAIFEQVVQEEGNVGAVPGLLWLQVPGQFLTAAAQTAANAFAAIAIALIYFDVRKRRDGADLEQAILDLESDS